MALVLTLKKGDGFKVGPHKFKVAHILSETRFRLQLPGGDLVEIDDQHATQVIPNVWVTCGTRGQPTLARITIEAPISMRICREQVGKHE